MTKPHLVGAQSDGVLVYECAYCEMYVIFFEIG